MGYFDAEVTIASIEESRPSHLKVVRNKFLLFQYIESWRQNGLAAVSRY